MKMSYKIALIVSVAVCALAVILITGPSDTDTPSPDTPPVADKPDAAPRKSLLSDASQAKPDTSTNGKKTQAPTATGKTLTQDVRSRIKAADDTQATQAEVITKAENTTENGTPNALALKRTDTKASSQPGKPETTAAASPAISSQALDAILGNTSKPKTTSQDSGSSTAAAANNVAPDAKGPAGDTASFAGGTYLIQPGDTFSSIADKHYGDESKWLDIAQANPTVDPARLRVGQELKLPAQKILREQTEPVPSGPDGIKTYTIRPGDSLSTVAKTYYGDPTLWRTIYNFNRDKIGENPNAIQAGMSLKVPPRHTSAQ